MGAAIVLLDAALDGVGAAEGLGAAGPGAGEGAHAVVDAFLLVVAEVEEELLLGVGGDGAAGEVAPGAAVAVVHVLLERAQRVVGASAVLADEGRQWARGAGRHGGRSGGGCGGGG